MLRATVAILAVVLLAAVAGLALPATASPQPSPVCPVCGQSFHENVTATDAALQVQGDGDVRWRIENEVRDPTATDWGENRTAVQRLVADRLDRRSRPPYDPVGVEVELRGDTLVIEFVDRGAARQRFGLLVLPYLHGEGVQARYVINADEFVVEAPAGQRPVNEPAGADVANDRVVWRGTAATGERMEHGELRTAPEPGDTYLVFGSGATAGARAGLATTLEPLDPGLYGSYVLGLLSVVGLTYGIYALQRNRLERRVVAGAVVAAALPYLYLVTSLHPPQAGGLGGAVLRVFAVAGTVLIGLSGGTLLGAWASLAGRGAEESS